MMSIYLILGFSFVFPFSVTDAISDVSRKAMICGEFYVALKAHFLLELKLAEVDNTLGVILSLSEILTDQIVGIRFDVAAKEKVFELEILVLKFQEIVGSDCIFYLIERQALSLKLLDSWERWNRGWRIGFVGLSLL